MDKILKKKRKITKNKWVNKIIMTCIPKENWGAKFGQCGKFCMKSSSKQGGGVADYGSKGERFKYQCLLILIKIFLIWSPIWVDRTVHSH
jgi:hypothetical protein